MIADRLLCYLPFFMDDATAKHEALLLISCIFCPLPPAMNTSAQSMSLSITPAQSAAWRKQIFEQLSERSRREMDNFRHYEQAIEQVLRPGEITWILDTGSFSERGVISAKTLSIFMVGGFVS